MRKKYIAITVFLGLMALLLAFMNFEFKASPPDKALRRTPKEAEIKYPSVLEANRGAELPQLSILWDKNLFSQGRRSGDKGDDSANPVKFNDLELVGICKFGESAGAIIVNKGNASHPLPPNLPGANPAMKGKVPGLNNMVRPNKADKRFYQLGQRMPNGFTLKEITTDSVVLARGSEEIVLKIQIGSKDGLKRMASFKPIEKETIKEELNKPPENIQEKKNESKEERKIPKPPSPPPMMTPGKNIKQA